MRKMWFLGGIAVGFVLGARAGREKYEELVQAARKVRESPTVQEAAGVVQEQATRLYTEGKEKVTDKLAHSRLAETSVGQRLLSSTESQRSDIDTTMATTGALSGTGTTGGSVTGSTSTPRTSGNTTSTPRTSGNTSNL
jgi:hypothetical protein